MVNIRLSATFVANDPVVSANPRAYLFVLGHDKNIVPSVSRSMATIADSIRNGSPFQINLIPNEDFQIDDTIFENLVKNSAGGGNTELLNRLLHYINQGVIEVHQDGGVALTAKQVLTYTAP
jgi:hypothetical protein